MKNHENRHIGSTPLPEVNEVYSHHARRGRGRDPSCGCGRGRDRGCNYDQERNSFPGVNHSPKKNQYKKEKEKDEKYEVVRTNYFRCSGRSHYERDCRTPNYLVELYQTSLRKKDKNSEANFMAENYDAFTHLDVADFFVHPEGK
ncbi:uncharacterized protein LOC129883651 [Solanum dulcamara]|uniref:uncharacterized protein LOC129883651 n=1 Tax=Solanum dulcamara TaxID=45834 RepID=UPI0024853C75|nr:uncharacterized protein LOC129883651 [Solanum dulcamara]